MGTNKLGDFAKHLIDESGLSVKTVASFMRDLPQDRLWKWLEDSGDPVNAISVQQIRVIFALLGALDQEDMEPQNSGLWPCKLMEAHLHWKKTNENERYGFKGKFRREDYLK